MKATCLKENLGRGLSITGGAITGKTAMSILQNVLMDARDGKLKLSGTNLETTITTWTDAEVHEPGEAAAPARLFSEFVGSLPGWWSHRAGPYPPPAPTCQPSPTAA